MNSLLGIPKNSPNGLFFSPEPDALPTDTYTLELEALINGEIVTTILAKDVPIAEIPEEPYTVEFISASVDFNPDALNLKSKGKLVMAYIELPIDYDVNEIDLESIRLNSQVRAELKPTEIGDYDKDGIPDLMVKFDRSAVQGILEAGDEVLITGKLTDIIYFEDSNTIEVINKGKKK